MRVVLAFESAFEPRTGKWHVSLLYLDSKTGEEKRDHNRLPNLFMVMNYIMLYSRMHRELEDKKNDKADL